MSKLAELRKNGMMAHLLDALEAGKDIGHYGRPVFTMVGHHFLDEDQIVKLSPSAKASMRSRPGHWCSR